MQERNKEEYLHFSLRSNKLGTNRATMATHTVRLLSYNYFTARSSNWALPMYVEVGICTYVVYSLALITNTNKV